MENQKEIEVTIDAGTGKEEDSLVLMRNLQKVIERQEFKGKSPRAEPRRKKIKPGEAGGAVESILTVILAAPAVIELVKVIGIWITSHAEIKKARIPTVMVTVEKKDGTKISVNAANISENELKVLNDMTDLARS